MLQHIREDSHLLSNGCRWCTCVVIPFYHWCVTIASMVMCGGHDLGLLPQSRHTYGGMFLILLLEGYIPQFIEGRCAKDFYARFNANFHRKGQNRTTLHTLGDINGHMELRCRIQRLLWHQHGESVVCLQFLEGNGGRCYRHLSKIGQRLDLHFRLTKLWIT